MKRLVPLLALLLAPVLAGADPVALGTRRILFVDPELIAERPGLELRLHPPQPRERVFTFDAPWEGSGSDFERVLRVDGGFRMYYMGTELTTSGGTLQHGLTVACVVESPDGIHWKRPDLALFEAQGSRHNNIVWAEEHLDNFTPFIDANPACPPGQRFKAMTSGGAHKLYAMVSADGLHWNRLITDPVMTEGQFDSQNNAFWDPVRRVYFCYIRGFHDPLGNSLADSQHGVAGIRDIRVSTSPDFLHWSAPRRLDYGDAPDEALYTNQIEPYYRAPELLVGFPTRYVERVLTPSALAALPDPDHRRRRMSFQPRYGAAVTDGLFMTSRDGYHFERWDEPFIPVGPERSNNWVYGDGYQSLGLIETPNADPSGLPELSCYVDEGHWKDGETLRRYTLRVDGFASLHAGRRAGRLVTPPFVFAGRRLSLNFSTSAAGSVRVALEDAAGRPLAGHGLTECDPLFGDTLDRSVFWGNSPEVAAFAGKPVRLEVVLQEADLYSLRFAP